MTLYLEALISLPGLTIGLALFLHEREGRVLRAGRPFGETGRHRRREERWSR